LRKIVDRILPKGGLGRAVATLASGTALGQLATVLATPVLSRLYSREDFGLLGLYVGILSTLAIIASGRFELATPIAEDDQEAANVLGAAALTTLVNTLAFSLILVLFGRPLLALVEGEALLPFAWVLPLGLLLQTLNQAVSYWAIRRKSYRSLATRKAQQGVFMALGQIALGVAGMKPLGLLLGHGVGQGFGGETLVRNAWREDKVLFKAITLSGMRRAMKRYARFPKMGVPAAFLNSLALTLPMLLMASYYGLEANGELQQAMKIMALPLSLIGAAVGQAFLGQAPKLLRDDPVKAQSLFDRVTGRLARFSLIVIVGGIAMIWLTPIFLGSQWKLAGIFMALLGFSCALQLVTSPISQITTILERQDLQLLGDAIRTVLIFAAFYGTYSMGGDATAAVLAYSATMTVTYVAFFLMYRRILRHAVKQRLAGAVLDVDESPTDPELPQ